MDVLIYQLDNFSKPSVSRNSLLTVLVAAGRKQDLKMSDLEAKIKEWLEWDKNPKTRAVIEDLVKQDNKDELNKILMNRIEFGTAGLRGKMSAGYACMNDLVIIQTAQGFLRYLEGIEKDNLKKKGIALGYDGRHNSRRWAELTAIVFNMFGQVPVYLYSQVCPTPLIPFTVRILGTVAGVMVTASHNPKDDNGYKVYGSNSAQIISPVDKQIQESILNNLKPWCVSIWADDAFKQCKNVSDPLKEVFDEYLKRCGAALIPEHKAFNGQTTLKFTYTAMHGVGYNYVKKLFEENNLSFVVVEEQKDPNPDFPTVPFPNPEEGKSALKLAMETADKNGSTIILANDPDADRLAVAEKNKCGQWRIFTGNEVGALLAFWTWHCHQTLYPTECQKNIYMLASTVSSKICKSMSNQEGFNYIDTLTGFKWLGNKSYELTKAGKKVIFCFEEAIGFMIGVEVLDKDGVSAALHVATMASYLNHHRLTLHDQLDEIYKEYGLHLTKNSYYICHEKETIKNIFDRLRNWDGKPGEYAKGILNGKYEIINVRDLTTGYDSSQPDKKAILPVSSSSQMITYEFKNGLFCTLRTSGTEPKIKYYTELCGPPGDMDRPKLDGILKEMVTAICEEFLEPQKNNIKPQGA